VISYAYKFVYVHIPKCAGTSVLGTFWKYFKKNLPPRYSYFASDYATQKVSSHYGKYPVGQDGPFKDYFAFTFVRNPWARTVSSWKWRRQQKWAGEKYSFDTHCRLLKDKKLIKHYVGKEGIHCWDQCDVIAHNIGSVDRLDFTGKVENIEHDFHYVTDQLGIGELKLSHANHSKNKKPYQEFFNDKNKEIIYNRYKKDIDTFEYTFES
tara:strand:- start:1120 stop:1746 length:627 start_codon:yes stop_codon:yes gene_type:complete